MLNKIDLINIQRRSVAVMFFVYKMEAQIKANISAMVDELMPTETFSIFFGRQ